MSVKLPVNINRKGLIMKMIAIVLGMMSLTSAFAECGDVSKIEKGAEKAFTKSDRPYGADGNTRFLRTTKNGKDKWIVEMNVQEECMTSVIVYTKEGSCTVVDAIEVGNRDCG